MVTLSVAGTAASRPGPRGPGRGSRRRLRYADRRGASETMQITCGHCGATISDNHRFCPVCGARMGGPAPASPVRPPGIPIPANSGAQVLAGRYAVDRVLGRGGMSTVYRAYDTHFSNRVVAVKEMVDTFATPE